MSIRKTIFDLSLLSWTLTGWLPHLWRLDQPVRINTSQSAEISVIPIRVPGSVQKALLDAGLIADWNKGLNYRDCQWVENLHWVYETVIPDEWIIPGRPYRLECEGLDGSGWVMLNGLEIDRFSCSHLPYTFDLSKHLKPGGNILHIIFDSPPRWCGQFGYTSRMTDWKVRFNYTWDWTARLVQIGIWDTVRLASCDSIEIAEFRAMTDIEEGGRGAYLQVWGKIRGSDGNKVQLSLEQGNRILQRTEIPAARFNDTGMTMDNLDVERWWPNLYGQQPLYTVRLTLVNHDGLPIETETRNVGFRSIKWEACKSAPKEAEPWICKVNGRRIFLQGANWVPIRPNFADVTEAQYRQWLTLYRDLGFNILRVWGGAILEKECFYRLCDELGIMVWQEFPLSSSGCDDYPPEDERFIREMISVAESYIRRRQHHTSLILWCGGNELITMDGNYQPVDYQHPMIAALKDVCAKEDSSRRFLATSPGGPRVHAHMSENGRGLHWDVHGPWKPGGSGMKDTSLQAWRNYWKNDDALLRSEVGCPGASPVDILKEYSGECAVMPPTASNSLWRRPTCWWIDYEEVVSENGREPLDLEEYIKWSQERQRQALAIAVEACKKRFPCCGGILIWMGHDCYPCAANTSIIDFKGRPKPVAVAISDIFRQEPADI